MALGPTVGGLLIHLISWRAVFWINLPICLAAIVLTAIFVPETRSATMRNIDPVGQLLAVVFLFGAVFTLIEGPALGWDNGRVIAAGTVAVLTFAAFLRYESRRTDPFIDLRFFRSVPFASATVIAICAFASWGALLFMMSLYLQGARGYSAVQTGLIYLPIAVGALVFSPLSGRLVGRYGACPSLLVSGVDDRRRLDRAGAAAGVRAGVGADGGVRRSSASVSRWSTRPSPTRRSAGCRWTGPVPPPR